MSDERKQTWATPRAYRRFLLDIRIVARTKESYHGRTKDISQGGLGATIAGDIKLGDVIELEFQVPESTEPLKLQAEVRYRKGFQYGFKFLHAKEHQLELIRKTTYPLIPAP
jgi:hypothetical protein